MKLSYAISVVDEVLEIQRLLTYLFSKNLTDTEIVVLFDTSKNCKEIERYLESIDAQNFSWYRFTFDRNFSNLKNKLNSFCKGRYILNLDADEMPHDYLIDSIDQLLSSTQFDLFLIPRINILTENFVSNIPWDVDIATCISFPDYQGRLYSNDPTIRWEGMVHEGINVSNDKKHFLPQRREFCIYHFKTFAKQNLQTELYKTLM